VHVVGEVTLIVAHRLVRLFAASRASSISHRRRLSHRFFDATATLFHLFAIVPRSLLLRPSSSFTCPIERGSMDDDML
jgi:hypothetical protein